MLFETIVITSLWSLLAGGAAIAVLTIFIIRYQDHIISWFQDRAEVVNADANNIAFTLKEKMNSGECAFVQGIFNKKSEKVEDVRRIKSEQVDEELHNIHQAKTLAIYQ
jgi:hypothetical protein